MAHIHCQNCFLCSSSCLDIPCPVHSCDFCGVKLHECKLSEHLSCICSGISVPCINSQYGCEQRVKRNKLGSHLEHCPASVVRCPFVYQRWQMEHYDPPSLLDVRIPDGKFLQFDKDFITMNSSSMTHTASLLNRLSIQCNVDYKHYVEAQEHYNDVNKHGTVYNHVKLYSNVYHLHTHRPDGIIPCHSFGCGKFVRRDQFQSHMINHLQFMIDLPLKVCRCPLYSIGCDFGTVRYQPKNCQFDFSSEMSSFVITNPAMVKSESSSSDDFSLLNLPLEVLLHILFYLDSMSYWSLSQTCWYFRNLCEDYLSLKGIVYFKWKRNQTNMTWSEGIKKWTFPRTFPSSHVWLPESSSMSISQHLMSTCQFMPRKYQCDIAIDLLDSLRVCDAKNVTNHARAKNNPSILILNKRNNQKYIFTDTNSSF